MNSFFCCNDSPIVTKFSAGTEIYLLSIQICNLAAHFRKYQLRTRMVPDISYFVPLHWNTHLNVAITYNELPNVLQVPSLAVTRSNGQSFVTVSPSAASLAALRSAATKGATRSRRSR